MAKNERAYTVYVIELDRDALADRDRPEDDKPVVYVGYTSHAPEVRLAKHQAAGRLAGAVFKRMKDPTRSRLRPDLARYPGPHATLQDALKNEKRTHGRLEHEGFVVFGDKGRKLRFPSPALSRRARS